MSLTGPTKSIETFIARWTAREGGAERANYQMFLTELCALIGVERPDPAGADTELNDYVFERHVGFKMPDGQTFGGRIANRGSLVAERRAPGSAGILPAFSDVPSACGLDQFDVLLQQLIDQRVSVTPRAFALA